MASDSQITPPAKNTRSKDAQRPRSASLPPEKPASRSPTPTSPINSLLPETELRNATGPISRGNHSCFPEELQLLPPTWRNCLVPYIRRGNHFRAANPAYLAEVVSRALPIIVRNLLVHKLMFSYFSPQENTLRERIQNPGSDLLDNFLAAVISLAHKVNKEAARTIVEWIRPKEQYIDEWVPINFELPTGHGLPRNSILETFTYTDYEITALTLFPYLRAPLMINETNAAEHIDEFREGMEFLDHSHGMECFLRHNLTDAWDKGVPFSVFGPPSPEAGPVINSEPPGTRLIFYKTWMSTPRLVLLPMYLRLITMNQSCFSNYQGWQGSLALREGDRNRSGQIPEVVIAPISHLRRTAPASRHLRLLRPANSIPAGPSNKPTPQPEDESEIDEPTPNVEAQEPVADGPPSKRLRTRKDSQSTAVAPSRNKKSDSRASSPRSSKQRRRKARKNSEEVVHEPGFPGTTRAGRSEAPISGLTSIAQAIEAVNRDSLHAAEVQRLADSANQRLRESSHHLSLLIRSMIAFYGKEGFSKLWEIPTPYKAVFMNFLAHETKHANEEFERNNAVNAAALVRFGSPVWDDEEREPGWPR
ncbi:hypothetical protein B0H13DRAFT_1904826 [Mycena leptocephala]|nr:hypothetical protein B0H13DRAFT_1904826 [Mycena leptocephala]